MAISSICQVDVFPSSFKWGLASSAVQIEGGAASDGKGPSVWDTKAKTPGQIFDGSEPTVTNDSYHLSDQDVKLLKDIGVTAYRFSISWPRVIPKGGRKDAINEAGLEYYSKLVDRLLDNGIEPFVTIYHWDTPIAIDEAYGSWRNPEEMVPDFARYAELLFERLGDRVKSWMTINEPIAMLFFPTMGGLYKDWDPAVDNWKAAYTLLRAHGTVVDIYRRKYQPTQRGTIGIVISADWPEPLYDSDECRHMCQRRMDYFFGLFADPIYLGKYPDEVAKDLGDRLPALTEDDVKLIKGSADNFCLNSYSSIYITGRRVTGDRMVAHTEMTGGVEETHHDLQGRPIGNPGQPFFLYDVPWGFRKMLGYVQQRYLKHTGLPLLITENGFSIKNEAKMTKEECLNDVERVNYYEGYLRELASAVKDDGLNCIAYFGWTIADNWEWSFGFGNRYGVSYVDRTSPALERTPKASARFLADFFRASIHKS